MCFMDDELKTLILLAQKGDKTAFGEIYKLYFQKIYRYCRINVYQDEIAQDICQETFVRAWKALPKFSFTNEGTLQAFLFRIARNLIIDLSRKKKEISLKEYHEIEAHDDISDQIDKEDEIAKVKKALAKLDELDRQIIVLRYFEELSHTEVARIVNIKEGALRVRTMRLLKKIKEMVD